MTTGSWMKLSLQEQQLEMEMVGVHQLESHYFQTEISQQYKEISSG